MQRKSKAKKLLLEIDSTKKEVSDELYSLFEHWIYTGASYDDIDETMKVIGHKEKRLKSLVSTEEINELLLETQTNPKVCITCDSVLYAKITTKDQNKEPTKTMDHNTSYAHQASDQREQLEVLEYKRQEIIDSLHAITDMYRSRENHSWDWIALRDPLYEALELLDQEIYIIESAQ